MITVRTGNYTQTEKENLSELFSYLAHCVCTYCDKKTADFAQRKCQRCEYRHVLYDICHVDSPKKNDNSVT